MAENSVGQVQLDLELNKKQYERGISDMQSQTQKATGKMGGMFQALGKTIAAAFAVKAIVSFGKACVNLGSDLAEVQNVVDATFTTLNEDVNKFAKNAINQFGLSETMAKRYTGTLGAMAKAFGFSEKEALKMSTSLTGLAGDVASFYNITQDVAYTKIKSVFTGETESLKDLGIVMTQSALDAFALANGIGKTTAKMTEQEKVSLRYKFILQQLSIASGDFSRTSDGWANQMRILSLQFDSLKASIGAGLINILLPVVKLLNTILGKLQSVADGFKKFTEMLTGKKSESSGMGAVNADLSNLASGADGASESIEGVGNAAEKAAKKAQKALAGIDEINILSNPNSDTSDSDTSGASGGTGFDFGSFDIGDSVDEQAIKATSALDKIKEKANELKNTFVDGFKQGLGDDFSASLDRTKEHILSIGDTLKSIFTNPDILSTLDTLVNSIAGYLGKVTGAAASIGATVSELLFGGIDKYLTDNKDYIIGTLTSIGDTLSGIYDKIGDFIVAFAEVFEVFRGDTAKSALSNLIGIFSNTFLGIVDLGLKFAEDILNCITQPFIDNKDKIKEAIENFLKPLNTVLETLNNSVKETFSAISEMYDEHLKPMFQSFADGFSDIVEKILDGYNTHIAPVLDKLANKFKEVWEGKIQPLINSAIELIGKIGDLIKTLWEEIAQPFIEWVINTVYPLIAPVIENIGTLVMDIIGAISDVIKGLIDTLGGIIDFIIGVFTGDWEKAWTGIQEIVQGVTDTITSIFEGIWTVLKGVINSILGGIENMANGVVKGINTVINALNGLSFDIPDWIPVIGGNTFGFNLKQLSTVNIPKLAEGGYVRPNMPQLAIVGDNKREGEIIAPESKIVDSVLLALSKFKQSESNNSNNNTGDIVLQIIMPNGNTEERRIRRDGKNPTMIYA